MVQAALTNHQIKCIQRTKGHWGRQALPVLMRQGTIVSTLAELGWVDNVANRQRLRDLSVGFRLLGYHIPPRSESPAAKEIRLTLAYGGRPKESLLGKLGIRERMAIQKEMLGC
jgi:hypothetical protein